MGWADKKTQTSHIHENRVITTRTLALRVGEILFVAGKIRVCHVVRREVQHGLLQHNCEMRP